MSGRGRFFAICCVDDSATKVSIISSTSATDWQILTKKQVVNELLTAAYAAEDGGPALVVIDSSDRKYVEPTHPPVDLFSSPFNGKDASQCCRLVRETTQQNQSDLNYEYLVILDKRSSEDSTALVVVSFDEEKKIQSVRAVYEVVNVILLSMSAGVGAMSEYQEIAAREPDGVFRFHPPPLKPETSTPTESAPGKFLKKHG